MSEHSEEKSIKEYISHPLLINNKKEHLRESRINGEFEKLPPLAFQKQIPGKTSRPRRNFISTPSKIPSSLTLNNNSINLPSTAPSTSSPSMNIHVTYKMIRLSCKNGCFKERDLGQNDNSYFFLLLRRLLRR